MTRAAAILFAGVTLGVVLFQIAMALGAPWGEYAMGGAFPGQFPLSMRVAALVQGGILATTAFIILVRARVLSSRHYALCYKLSLGVVGLSALSLTLNWLTPSARERAIWAPVAALLFTTSLFVVMKTRRRSE